MSAQQAQTASGFVTLITEGHSQELPLYRVTLGENLVFKPHKGKLQSYTVVAGVHDTCKGCALYNSGKGICEEIICSTQGLHLKKG